jgi:hypothetical protein
MPMDYSKERLVRYYFQLTDCVGQPLFMQSFWIPELTDGSRNWGDIFQGPPPTLNNREHKTVKIDPEDDYSAQIVLIRE